MNRITAYETLASDRQYLMRLISEGEHQQQDFKYKVQDARKLARSVSAFANTDGGRLLIGVRDDGHLSGVRDEEEIYMMHQAAYKFCRPEASIKFDTYHVATTLDTGRNAVRTIVVATVPPSERKPIYAIDDEGRRRAYIRIADENIVASPVHIIIWREEASTHGLLMQYTDSERQLMDVLATTTRQTLNQLVRRTKMPRRKTITLLARLVRYGLAEWHFEDHRFLFSLVK